MTIFGVPLNYLIAGALVLAGGGFALKDLLPASVCASLSGGAKTAETEDAANWSALRRLWKLMKTPEGKAAFKTVQTEVLDSVDQG